LLGCRLLVVSRSEQFKDLFHDLRRRRNVILFPLQSSFLLNLSDHNIASLSRHMQNSGHDVQIYLQRCIPPPLPWPVQTPTLAESKTRYLLGQRRSVVRLQLYHQIPVLPQQASCLPSFGTLVSTLFSKPSTFCQCSLAKEDM
jgi:hypothetical protein